MCGFVSFFLPVLQVAETLAKGRVQAAVPSPFHSPLLGNFLDTSVNCDGKSRVVCCLDDSQINLSANCSKKSYACTEYVTPQNSVSELV
jgi:hypothetical protein